MNREERGIMVGMILGDGCLNVRQIKGTTPYIKSEMRIVHSYRQIDYLNYKAELVRKILGGKHTVSIYNHVIPKLGKTYRMCGFSKSHKCFKALKKITHREGKKYFSSQALGMLTPHGIAIWYMDDGSAGRNHNKLNEISSVYSTISTYCTEIEAQNICDLFLENYGIRFRIGYERAKHSHIVRANTKETHQFVDLIRPFIVPSMEYKISHVQDLKEHEHQTTLF